MEAIIIAGGKGTRLQSVIKEIPKPMAPINGRPFLEYLLDYLMRSGCSKVILSVGYKYNVIYDHFGEKYKELKLQYAVEKEPLGTGGGIKLALTKAEYENVIVLNGDSFFNIDIALMMKSHEDSGSLITMAVKPMHDFDRYGSVGLDDSGCVKSFEEKVFCNYGLVNAGVYILNKHIFEIRDTLDSFSFEDFLQKNTETLSINAFSSESYFVDIGIPEDYEKAQKDLTS